MTLSFSKEGSLYILQMQAESCISKGGLSNASLVPSWVGDAATHPDALALKHVALTNRTCRHRTALTASASKTRSVC